MEETQQNHQQTTIKHGIMPPMAEQHVDMESDHTRPEKTSQEEERTIIKQNGDNDTKVSTKPIARTKEDSNLKTTAAHDIEGGSIQHDDDDSIDPISGVGKLDFFIGALLGLLAGPFSLLVVKCWHDMAQHEVRRAKFLLGCSMGIILQIIGFAIVFSIFKLSSRRG